jgi:hypothetical protein
MKFARLFEFDDSTQLVTMVIPSEPVTLGGVKAQTNQYALRCVTRINGITSTTDYMYKSQKAALLALNDWTHSYAERYMKAVKEELEGKNIYIQK